MHIHGNQFDPRIEVYELSAEAKEEAKREAERVRKRLQDAGSRPAAEEADCVVELSGEARQDAEPEEHASRQGEPEGEQKQASADGEETFSDYA